MLRFISVLFLTQLLSVSFASADDYSDFVKILNIEANLYRNALNAPGDGAIYTKKTLNSNLSFIKNSHQNLKSTNDLQQKILTNAGRRFLSYLQSSNIDYHKLSFKQWKPVFKILMEIDKLSENKIAWGNLIIKLNICNKLFNWVFDYIELNSSSISEEMFNELLVIQDRIRHHFPSRDSLFYISLRHYGHKNLISPKSFILKKSLKIEEIELGKKLNEYFDGFENSNAIIYKYIASERKLYTSNYLNLYDNPIPMSIAFASHLYFHSSWELYLYTKILRRNGGDFDGWEDLTLNELRELLHNEYNSNGKIWVTTSILDYAEDDPNYLKFYLNSVKEQRTMKVIRNFRKLSLDSNNRISRKWFFINRLP